MGRPRIGRQINNIPDVLGLMPITKESEVSNAIVLMLEEVEAIRLKDIEDLDQMECASIMGVSRPTFRRILVSARKKVAESLIGGRAIVIESIEDSSGYTWKCDGCGQTRRYQHGAKGGCPTCDNSPSANKGPNMQGRRRGRNR